MRVAKLIEELKGMPQDGIIVYKDYPCVKSENEDDGLPYGVSEEIQVWILGDDGEPKDLVGTVILNDD